MSLSLENIEISPEIKVSQPRKKRCLNISARDFAAILGQDPYTDAWKLLEQKVESLETQLKLKEETINAYEKQSSGTTNNFDNCYNS